MERALAVWCFALAGCAATATAATAEAQRRPRPRGVRWDERPVDDLVAEAARTNKRVFLDFYADW